MKQTTRLAAIAGRRARICQPVRGRTKLGHALGRRRRQHPLPDQRQRQERRPAVDDQRRDHEQPLRHLRHGRPRRRPEGRVQPRERREPAERRLRRQRPPVQPRSVRRPAEPVRHGDPRPPEDAAVRPAVGYLRSADGRQLPRKRVAAGRTRRRPVCGQPDKVHRQVRRADREGDVLDRHQLRIDRRGRLRARSRVRSARAMRGACRCRT